jgi:hypothetical protein
MLIFVSSGVRAGCLLDVKALDEMRANSALSCLLGVVAVFVSCREALNLLFRGICSNIGGMYEAAKLGLIYL